MEWNQIQGNWKQVTGKIKEKWGDLTDDELTKNPGQARPIRRRAADTLRKKQGSRPQGRG